MYNIDIINKDYFKKVIYFDEVDSTNNIAKSMARREAAEPTLIIAERQTAGRGRSGNRWISNEGTALMFSMLLYPRMNPRDFAKITLFAGLCMCQALDAFGIPVMLKWPNDILLNRKKICGILTESGKGYCVMGIGMNIKDKDMPEELHGIATSIYMETGVGYSREDVLNAFLKVFTSRYGEFESGAPFIHEYKCRCANLGRAVSVMRDGETAHGVAVDVDDNGCLIMETHCVRTAIHAGEVALHFV